MNLKKIIYLLLVMFGLCFIISCDNREIDNISISEDKTYHGIAMGYNDVIEVDVTINNDNIKDVRITKQNETKGIGAPLVDTKRNIITIGGESPISLIPKMIVKIQSINVDAVTGATATSYGILHAVSDALISAGYRVDAVTAATEVKTEEYNKADVNLSIDEKKLLDKWLIKANYDTNNEDMTTDVVVIGGGGAGLASAISASENGAKVIVIEKNAEVGGDTLVCGAIYNAPNKDLQNKVLMNESKKSVIKNELNDKAISNEHEDLINEVKTQFEEYIKHDENVLFDSKEWYALQTFNGGDNKANLSLVKTLCYNAYDGLMWIKNLGVSFYDYISQGAGSLWERTHTNTMPMGTGFISNYLENINKSNNIQIITNTTAMSIKKNDVGKVNVVHCKDKYGNEFDIYANKAIVLATGGFSANNQMIDLYNNKNSKWNDIILSELLTTNRKTVSNGDGIKIGIELDADLVDMSEIQLLYLGNIKNGELTKYPPRCVNATDQIIFINKYGERFTNEAGRRDKICKDILNEPDKMFYIIESADGDKYIDIYSNDFISADGFTFDYLEKNNYIYVGDTIEELAQKLNIENDILQKTIEDFNQCVDGKADIYGRTLFSTKIEHGPYIATPRKVSVHHTMGGLKIDENAHVIDKNGDIIKGLYAAGEVTGGIHGSNRLGGNAVVDTVVFGRIAGENAALEK